MKTLGIVGGIAPPSTIDYYRQLTAGYRVRSHGGYPAIVITSIDAAAFFALLDGGDRARMTEVLLVELRRLASAGVDLAILASNTPHLVFDQLASASPVPLISIVEETARVAERQGFGRLGLLGARFTMEAEMYPAAFARRGMMVVAPDDQDRAYVHERYFGELVDGTFRDETRAGISAVIDRMVERDGIQAVILGGTELPLLFRGGAPTSVPALDTTAIHVAGALDWLLA